MAKSYGRKWWWMSFWFVGAAQQLMLCPLVYPIYVISVSGKSDFAIMDCISVLGCLSGLVIAFFADNQLYDYCSSKRTTKVSSLEKRAFYKDHNVFILTPPWQCIGSCA